MHINDILDLPNLQAVIARFERKFVRLRTKDCWEWIAGKDSRGYGGVTINWQAFGAHRVSYVLYKGSIEEVVGYHGICVLHRCDNPGCVNPSHLFLGMVADNAADMVAKKRSLKGSNNPASKLSEKDIRKIRSDPRTLELIGLRYGVSKTTISRLKLGYTWKHVE